MREKAFGQEAVYLLHGDHLGSTTVVSTLSGGFVSSQHYKPWGEVRHAVGELPTDYGFTGQRSEMDGIGLYYYNARWYDPVIGRFVQADPIVPDPGNPLDLDRYAYVRNNPMKYIDPTGHFCVMVGNNQVCSADPDSDGHWRTRSVGEMWGWQIQGRWSHSERSKIQESGFTIASYMYRQGTNGDEWIRQYLGNAVFRRDWRSSVFFKNFPSGGFVGWKSTIRLPEGFNTNDVTHELGHVMDNNFKNRGILPATWGGRGVAERYVQDMGGNPNSCFPRWKQCVSYWNNAGEDPWDRDHYGSHSLAEDFAVTFEYLFHFPTDIPERRRIWMEAFIAAPTSFIP
jgi:RHS repeat-associated protein